MLEKVTLISRMVNHNHYISWSIEQNRFYNLHCSKIKTGRHSYSNNILKYHKNEIITLKTPIVLNWHITNRCPMKCPFCFESKKGKDLDKNDINKIISKLNSTNIIKINLSGGDPLVYEHFDYLAKKLFENNYVVSVTSASGNLIKEKIQTIKRYCNILYISLDTSNPTIYNKSKGCKGLFHKNLDAIKIASNNGINVIINTVVTKQTLTRKDDLKKLTTIVRDLGAKEISFMKFLKIGEAVKTADLYDISQKDFLKLTEPIKLKFANSKFRVNIKDNSYYGDTFNLRPEGEVINLNKEGSHIIGNYLYTDVFKGKRHKFIATDNSVYNYTE